MDFDGNGEATAYEFGVQGRSAPPPPPISSPPPTITGDDPTLINITNLEQLDAMRYDLDGDGTPTGAADDITAYEAAFGLAVDAVISCTGGCTGYELMNDLDFEDADSNGTADDKSIWAEGAYADGINDPVTGAVEGGWLPIGSGTFVDPNDNDPREVTSPRDALTAIFDGGGYSISNLYMERSAIDHVVCLAI